MIRLLLFTFCLLCFSISSGQIKNVNGVISATGDTSFWYKFQIKQLNKLSLPLLDTSTNAEIYRVWTNRQVVEVWQNHNGSVAGKLITWTDEYVPNNERPTTRSFIKVDPLTRDTAQLVRQLFLSSGILQLPADYLIQGWQQGFDGIEYIIEHSTKDTYSFKTYRTPKAQDTLREAVQVQAFIDSAFTFVNAQPTWQSFSKTIPFECYINGGPSVACKVLTPKDRKKYIKERKNYRQQMHL